MTKLYFEDITIGDVWVGDAVTAGRDEMIAFAREYDNQPMHVDPAGDPDMEFGDVIAAGAFTFALLSQSLNSVWGRLHFLPSGIGMKMEFAKPVFPGDVLTAHATVTDKRPSRRSPRGLINVTEVFLDQNGESVLNRENIWLVRRSA